MGWYALVGWVAAFLTGLTGVGAGTLVVPPLVALLGVSPIDAIQSALVYTLVIKLLGGFQHWRQGNVDGATLRRLLIGGLPGVLMGAGAVALGYRFLDGWVEVAIQRGIGWVVLGIALSLVLPNQWRWRPRLEGRALTIASCVLGVLVGMTGMGSGTLFITLLIGASPLPPRKVVGTVTLFGVLLTLVGSAVYAFGQPIRWDLVGWILLGAIPGVVMGSYATLRFPERVMVPIIAAALAVVGIRLV